MKCRASAFKHGVLESSIRHAIRFALFVDDDFQKAELPKVLIIGPDGAGNMLEVVGRFDSNDSLIVVHAMAARASLLRLIEAQNDEG